MMIDDGSENNVNIDCNNNAKNDDHIYNHALTNVSSIHLIMSLTIIIMQMMITNDD